MAASNNIATALFSRSTEIANPVIHSALDVIERPSVLINYEGSFDQEVFPSRRLPWTPIGFFCNRRIDLNRICLPIEVFLYQPDGTEKVKPADVDLTFANNTLHSLFSHVEMFLHGKMISSSNNNYHFLASFETELTTDLASKLTWAPCQGYKYRANDKANHEVKEKELNEFRKGEQFNLELYGAPHIDFLDCERLLLPGVTLHLRFYRSPNNCAIESVGPCAAADIRLIDQAPCALVIERASLFVNKVVLSDAVKVRIERALTKIAAVYPYIESLNKSFIIKAGQRCFVKENVFGTEPVRRLILCMVRNKFFRGSTTESTPFQYKKVSIEQKRNSPRQRRSNRWHND